MAFLSSGMPKGVILLACLHHILTNLLQLILIQVVGTKKDTSFAEETVKALNAAAVATAGSAFRIVAEHAPLSVARQWEDAVKGGQGVWEGAEAIIRERTVRK